MLWVLSLLGSALDCFRTLSRKYRFCRCNDLIAVLPLLFKLLLAPTYILSAEIIVRLGARDVQTGHPEQGIPDAVGDSLPYRENRINHQSGLFVVRYRWQRMPVGLRITAAVGHVILLVQ
ncbi:MAG: hypothetical protein NXY57DRAFT_740423 [Lentinula lateritia]|nr:MAG: hypothetical protein NXY57DRAFT_740423 [Lentinula lateritia]